MRNEEVRAEKCVAWFSKVWKRCTYEIDVEVKTKRKEKLEKNKKTREIKY